MPGSSAQNVQFPATLDDLQSLGRQFAKTLKAVKSHPLPGGLSWYPYDTVGNLRHLSVVLQNEYAEFARALEAGRVIDIGCADGDLGMLFASLGLPVTCVDNAPTNYNRMIGVRTLAERLHLEVEVLERDVDSQFLLPDEKYGLVLALGILYHLKNPFYFLETLASKVRYCALSTRVAVTTKSGTNMNREALAYLLGPRETNNDDTNYWIFSPVALRLLLKRAGWTILSETVLGSVNDSNPVDADKDSRMFVFLRSDRASISAKIDLADGWTEITEFDWAWTLKRFTLHVQLLRKQVPQRFSLTFYLTAEMVKVSPVVISCRVNGLPAGTQTFDRDGVNVFEGTIPEAIGADSKLIFAFAVEHRFKPAVDTRDLGIIVRFSGNTASSKTPQFWLG